MPRLPRIPAAPVIRALKRAGFYEFHQSGSHMQLRHLVRTELRVTIPFTRRDFAPKTLKVILMQAKLSVDEFIELL